jgi:hypothetical protein
MEQKTYKFKPLVILAVQVPDGSKETVKELNKWLRSLSFSKEEKEFDLIFEMCPQIFLFGKGDKEHGVLDEDYIVAIPELKTVEVYRKDDFNNYFEEAKEDNGCRGFATMNGKRIYVKPTYRIPPR